MENLEEVQGGGRMKLCELAYVIWSGKVLIFIEEGKEYHEFVSTGWGDDRYNAIRKACKEFGDRLVVCLFPLSQNEMTITIK